MALEESRPVAVAHSGQVDGENYEYHWSGSHIEAHLLSDVGKKREHNEDSCILCVPEETALAKGRGFLFAVADGMGGASAGEFASAMALAILTDHYYSDTEHGIPQRLCAALGEANRRIFDEAERNADRHGMGTTASIVVVADEWAYIAQVGDSRVYVQRPKHPYPIQITEDHSVVAEQVKGGYITEQEAKTHTLRNLITRAVGIAAHVTPDLFAFRLRKDDTLLICSDGLSNLVTDSELSKALECEDLDAATHELVDHALDRGGSDNITAILIRITQDPEPRMQDSGATEVVFEETGIFSRLLGAFRKRQ